MGWKKFLWYAFPSLIVILGISYLAGDLEAIPSGLVAWGTILLAFATFTLIRHSREQEEQRRKDDQAREKRDNDERLLNEIIRWATDVASCRVERGIKEVIELQYSFEITLIRAQYITNIIEPFPPSLKASVNNLTNALTHHIKLIQQYRDVMDEKDKRDAKVKKITDHNTELEKHFTEVVEQATTAKLAVMH